MDGPEHAERRDDEEEVVNIDMKDNEAEEHVEEKKKKMEEESEKEKEDEDEEKVEGEEKGEEKRGEEDEDGDEDFQEMVNIDMKDNEEEEYVEEKKKKMEEESEKEKEEEETEEGEEKGEEKRGEEDEDGDEDEDEIVDICVDDTQSAATAIFGEDVNHFPYSLSGHCGFAVSDPMSDSAHSASITAGSMHKPTSLAAVELECAACPAPPHAEESKEQELCLSNPPHAFPSPSPLAFPYTSDSLSATPMAARSSDMRELVAVPNDGSSTKRPDTQSSSTQYTQPGLLKCDYEGSSAAHTCLAATHVVPCEILMTEASASGKAAEAGAEATSGVPESIPIPISQYASSPVWATKGSETAGSYVGYTLTSSFGAGKLSTEPHPALCLDLLLSLTECVMFSYVLYCNVVLLIILCCSVCNTM